MEGATSITKLGKTNVHLNGLGKIEHWKKGLIGFMVSKLERSLHTIYNFPKGNITEFIHVMLEWGLYGTPYFFAWNKQSITITQQEWFAINKKRLEPCKGVRKWKTWTSVWRSS
jgi:hypothetical protein